MSYEVTLMCCHKRIDDTGSPLCERLCGVLHSTDTIQSVFYFIVLWIHRKGETLALHWNDIDFKEKKISISKSVGMTENGF